MAERAEAALGWQDILTAAVSAEVSDIHLTAEQTIYFRKDGELLPQGNFLPTIDWLDDMLTSLLTETQREIWNAERELDFAYSFEDRRFRGNVYYQQGLPALSLRLLPAVIPSLEAVRAPRALCDMVENDAGLILVCGRTGAGKSTTLAAFIDKINSSKAKHIITLEDPIEYILPPRRSFISQRELGKDFRTFAGSLRSSLREDPDVILVGEIRDRETFLTALMAAMTGVLVLGTLHTRSVSDSVQRIEGMFRVSEQEAIRSQLADVLAGLFVQELVPKIRGGRIALTEVLVGTPAVRNIIRQGKYAQLTMQMMSGKELGMQTREMAVAELAREKLIETRFV